jgi:hypothetical protein
MTGAQSRLMALTKEHQIEWENTKHNWNDAKSQEFEKRYLAELIAAVNHSLSNIDTLERLIAKIHADCD